MVLGGVGPGVAGPQPARQRLPGLVQVDKQGMEPEPLLVGGGRSRLLREGLHQGGVEVQGRPPRSRTPLPDPGPGSGPGSLDPLQHALLDRLHHPPGGGLGGHLSEQAGLVAEHLQVREAVAAVGQGYRQVHQH
jgi:hypothetical protein